MYLKSIEEKHEIKCTHIYYSYWSLQKRLRINCNPREDVNLLFIIINLNLETKTKQFLKRNHKKNEKNI